MNTLGIHWVARRPTLGVGDTPEEALADLATIPNDIVARVGLKQHEYGWRFGDTSLSAAAIGQFQSRDEAAVAGIPPDVLDAFESVAPAYGIYGQALGFWMLEETPRLFPEE